MTNRQEILRASPLIDIQVGGDGRTVTAYAATFSEPYEVEDFDGHYDEIINPRAFTRSLRQGFAGRVQALFNHGRTIAGTPSDRYSMPLGTPLEIRPEPRGLLTVTRYAKTPLADEVLELIGGGAITAQSFRGPIFRSAPPRPGPNMRPIVERLELGLRDYGPAPFAVNTAAQFLAVRSEIVAERLQTLDDLTDEERAELARLLAEGTPSTAAAPAEDSPPSDTPPPPAEEAPETGPSVELLELAAAQRRRRD